LNLFRAANARRRLRRQREFERLQDHLLFGLRFGVAWLSTARGVSPGAALRSFIRNVTVRQYARKATKMCASTRGSV
jgi:hypothetical protein